jgi:hypothetical protein
MLLQKTRQKREINIRIFVRGITTRPLTTVMHIKSQQDNCIITSLTGNNELKKKYVIYSLCNETVWLDLGTGVQCTNQNN